MNSCLSVSSFLKHDFLFDHCLPSISFHGAPVLIPTQPLLFFFFLTLVLFIHLSILPLIYFANLSLYVSIVSNKRVRIDSDSSLYILLWQCSLSILSVLNTLLHLGIIKTTQGLSLPSTRQVPYTDFQSSMILLCWWDIQDHVENWYIDTQLK